VSACDTATTPSVPTFPTPVTPTTEPELREVRLLDAPSNLRIGQTAYVRALAAYSDGGLVDVTGQASWSSTADACAVAKGTVTGVSAGVAEIRAQVDGLQSAVARIACGYVITVTTHESLPTEHVMVPGVTGEILEGPLAGYRFATDGKGQAMLPPVAAPGFRIQFKKHDFENEVVDVRQLPLQTSLDVALTPEPNALIERTGVCRDVIFGTTVRVPFIQGRAGKVRLSVRLLATPGAPWEPDVSATVYKDGDDTVILMVSDYIGPPSHTNPDWPTSAEGHTSAGAHALYYAANDCGPATEWRAVVEYVR
jgi:hypothetical protein